jgi:hypothetical protein
MFVKEIFNEQPQGKPRGIDEIFRCLIRLTYLALPNIQITHNAKSIFKFPFSLFTVVANCGVLNRIGFA